MRRKKSSKQRTASSRGGARPAPVGGRPAPNGRQTARQSSGASRDAEGVVSANRGGFGFVRIDGLEEGVFLPPPEMAGVMHGDRVRIAVSRDARDRTSGRVLAVLERGLVTFLGTVEKQGPQWYVRAADRRLNLRCRLAASQGAPANPLAAGDWVIARVTRYPESGSDPLAEIHRRLDPDRPVHMAAETAIAKHALPVEFGAEAQRDAERWGASVDPAEAARRVDLRALPLVTIDGETARDFDDAVYAEREGDGFRLIVAIADVSYYVRPGTALDREAMARGTSVYFPTRVIPMLPAALSDELCSLKPKVDRLCMVADMRVSARGQLLDTKVYPAVMRSAARLTYTAAHAALFERQRAARDALGPLVESLEPLLDLYRALVKARNRRGALNFDAPEAEFEIRAGEHVHAIRFEARNDAHKLIEECMVLSNVAVAQSLRAARIPALYRVHAPPEERKLKLLRATLRVLGMDVELPEEVSTRDLAAIAPRVREPEARPFVESLIVRSMAQALYAPDNIGHFGLALKDYAHFTSPIRRYPDLLIHRALRAMLERSGARSGDATESGHGAASAATLGRDELVEIGAELSRLEKRADEADRYVNNFLKCVYLRDRLGQTFDGLVTTVTEFGCFISLIEVGIDGLLHVSTLRDDDYQMSRDGAKWLGKRTGRQLGPGARLRVDVIAARPVEGAVDLELADE